MVTNALLGLAAILVLGVGAQWVAWRLRQPSILLLLVVGFLAGPVTGLLDPDALLGDLLLPFVSLSVALILFEGGLSLNLREIQGLKGVLGRLIVLGGALTLVAGLVAAHWIVGLDLGLAALLGAVLVVSGPTVVGPILRHVRPQKDVASLLKWEALVIDPLGVLVAVLIFEALLAVDAKAATATVVSGLVLTLVAGTVIGGLAALLLGFVIDRDLVPDFLQSPVTVMLVITAATAADEVQPESGLLAVTLMGALLANQRAFSVRHIVEFKENLRVLLLASIFIVLSARVTRADIAQLGWSSLAFLAVLVVVARPLSVLVATAGSKVGWNARAFLALMHPRGVVSASMSAVFALRLAESGREGAQLLVPLTLLVIVGTIVVHGMPAAFVAGRLGVAQPAPQGVLLVGSTPWSLRVAEALQAAGVRVVVADSNWRAVAAARLRGLPAWHGDVLAEHSLDEIDLQGVGRLLAVTANDEVNSLAALHFAEVFGRDGVYQLPPTGEAEGEPARARHLRGRLLWGREQTYDRLRRLFTEGAEVRRTPLTEEFDFEAFRVEHGERAVPLFLLENGTVRVFTVRNPPEPRAGQVVMALVPVDPDSAGATS